MSKDPAFLFYTQDFIMGTVFMSNEQLGIYVRLLCSQHQHGGLIDKDSFNSMVGTHNLIRSKFIETDEGFYNKRMMEEMSKRQKKSSNLSLNAQKRWKNECKSNAIASQLHMPIEDENENKDINKDINTTILNTNIYITVFEELWSKYPRRQGKKAAFKHFNSSIKSDQDVQLIQKALNNYITYIEINKTEEKYIKHGSSWFNNWQDWVEYKQNKPSDNRKFIN